MADKIKVSEQYFSTAPGPLDAKLGPVQNLAELYAATKRSQRYKGMTVLVLDDGTGEGPTEYWLVKDTNDASWEKKKTSGTISITGDDIDND